MGSSPGCTTVLKSSSDHGLGSPIRVKTSSAQSGHTVQRLVTTTSMPVSSVASEENTTRAPPCCSSHPSHV